MKSAIALFLIKIISIFPIAAFNWRLVCKRQNAHRFIQIKVTVGKMVKILLSELSELFHIQTTLLPFNFAYTEMQFTKYYL